MQSYFGLWLQCPLCLISAANIASLINYARQKGKWDFFCRGKQLVLITCLEDSTNEVLPRCLLQSNVNFAVKDGMFAFNAQIRELSAGLLLTFFQSSFPDDIATALLARSKQLLCSPRVQDAQMGALMTKVLLQK